MQTPLMALIMVLMLPNLAVAGRSDCSTFSNQGCKVCVNEKSWDVIDNCRWCPLDYGCHAVGSPLNPCNEHDEITTPAKCPKDDDHSIYDHAKAVEQLKLSAVPYAHSIEVAKKCLETAFAEADFEMVEFIGRHCEELPLIDYKVCVAVVLVSHKKKIISVAYRGTSSVEQLVDLMGSVLLTEKVPSGYGGNVQKYFKDVNDKLYDCVSASVGELVSLYPAYDVWITGHSLGGAVASIASGSLIADNIVKKDKLSLYTFGMPRVGDRDYAVAHNELVNNSWRLTHHHDPVPHLPVCTFLPDSPYHHKTEVHYPNKQMLPTDINYIICPGSDNVKCGSIFNIPSVEDHKYYFDIHVGAYCQMGNGASHMKPKSEMLKFLKRDKCTRVKLSDFKRMVDTQLEVQMEQKPRTSFSDSKNTILEARNWPKRERGKSQDQRKKTVKSN